MGPSQMIIYLIYLLEASCPASPFPVSPRARSSHEELSQTQVSGIWLPVYRKSFSSLTHHSTHPISTYLPFFHPSIHPSFIFLFLHVLIHPSSDLLIHLSIFVSILHQLIHPSIHLSIRLSISLSISTAMFSLLHPPDCLSLLSVPSPILPLVWTL